MEELPSPLLYPPHRPPLTLTEAMQTLREVVADNADHVDPNAARGDTCRYFTAPDGPPSCGIGHVLHRHDIRIHWDGPSVASEVLGWPLLLSADAKAAMWAFQLAQDSGAPWGKALAMAEAVAAGRWAAWNSGTVLRWTTMDSNRPQPTNISVGPDARIHTPLSHLPTGGYVEVDGAMVPA